VSQTYSDVDASADPAEAVAWQERMSRWPAVAAYKARTHELLGGADPVLDVGCGPGVDVAALGVDRCVGVDASETMTEAADRRGAVTCRADAHRLGFRDGAFAGVRADRVLQHLAAPHRALREMVRVVAVGGRVVIADPDQETLVIRVPGVRRSVLDRLEALRRDVGYRNGTLISKVPGMLERVGVDHVTVDAFPLAIRDPGEAFGLPTWPAAWRHRGAFTDEEIREWDEAMQGASSSGFLYLVTFLVVAGTRVRPAPG
jgi:SAM-dependent methyltransferase